MALISKDEQFCVMCGRGIIIYYLHKPFEEYEYQKETGHWKEWGRIKGNERWVEGIKCIDDKTIEIESVEFDVY